MVRIIIPKTFFLIIEVGFPFEPMFVDRLTLKKD